MRLCQPFFATKCSFKLYSVRYFLFFAFIFDYIFNSAIQNFAKVIYFLCCYAAVIFNSAYCCTAYSILINQRISAFECDGYKFGGADTEGNPFGSSDDNINWYTGATLDLDVLFPVKYYRGVIEIPEELAKSNEPIYLHVQMATENEGMTIMGYELCNPEYKPDK